MSEIEGYLHRTDALEVMLGKPRVNDDFDYLCSVRTPPPPVLEIWLCCLTLCDFQYPRIDGTRRKQSEPRRASITRRMSGIVSATFSEHLVNIHLILTSYLLNNH
jgi:hypothetical protein